MTADGEYMRICKLKAPMMVHGLLVIHSAGLKVNNNNFGSVYKYIINKNILLAHYNINYSYYHMYSKLQVQ